ncbi:MAG: prepilin-type N-terminal cleavage/methylation domain-containing protein [Candidatus Omnitrophica bacterium]|nr:prepilin-type N-terminal cleavage/methylation domain-containing protein [Candidatus Omnitrophota bacterium]
MRSIRRPSSARGFTLVEVLVVTLILSVISVAIFNTFANGLAIYRRLSTEIPGERTVLFLERLSHDVHNSFEYASINFTGEDAGVEFASIVWSPAAKKHLPGRIRYVCDSDKESLVRFEGDYFSVFEQKEPASRHRLEGVASCVFRYYSYDEEKKEYSWLEDWTKQGLPNALRLEITFKDDAAQPLIRTFEIPAGNARNNSES